MSAQQISWFADIAAAAEELGYRVHSISPDKVRLDEIAGEGIVVLRNAFLSGALLRRVLAKPRGVRIENSADALEDPLR